MKTALRNFVVASASLLIAAAPAAADEAALPTEPTAPESKPAGAGFELAYPYWLPEGHGAPKALVARYTWKGLPERTTSARLDKHGSTARKDWRWVFTFADQPNPDEVARIDLLYQFELTPADQELIAGAARTLAAEAVLAFRDARKAAARTDDAAFAAEIEQRTKTLAASADAQALMRFGDAAGDDGLDLMLKTLGLEQASSGGWSPTPRAGLLFVELSAALASAEPQDDNEKAALAEQMKKLEAAKANGGASGACAAAGDDVEVWLHDPVSAGRVLQACLPELAEGLRAALEAQQKDAEKAAEDAKKAAGDADKAAKDAEAAAGKKVDDTRKAAANLTAAIAAWKTDVTRPFVSNLAEVAVAGGANVAASYAYNASKLAQAVSKEQARSAKWKTTLDHLTADVALAFERANLAQPGSTVVSGGLKPRRYDVATGVIFVLGLEDTVVPTVISVCGSLGCLKQDEVFWSAERGFRRSFSFDAGIRAKTLNTQDPRQPDGLSYVVGLSWNPVSVFRLSGGVYAFENAQSGNWNLQPYVGLTFNVLNAAELLGNLGLGPQFAPKPVETK